MRTSIVMEPRQVLRERLMALTRLRIVQIQECANLNHNHVRGAVSRRLLVLQHHPEGLRISKKTFFINL